MITIIRPGLDAFSIDDDDNIDDVITIIRPSLDAFLSDPSPIIALPCQSVRKSLALLNFVQIVGYVKGVSWISLRC